MPPRLYSRFTFSLGLLDADGKLFLTDYVPFRFQSFSDNITHTVKDGESLFTIAARYYRTLPRPAGLFWVIADFQPEPIFDPTIVLEPGRALIIPSLRTVIDEIFNPRRASEQEIAS